MKNSDININFKYFAALGLVAGIIILGIFGLRKYNEYKKQAYFYTAVEQVKLKLESGQREEIINYVEQNERRGNSNNYNYNYNLFTSDRWIPTTEPYTLANIKYLLFDGTNYYDSYT